MAWIFAHAFHEVPLHLLWSASKLSSVTESGEEMPFSFPDSYIPTVTKIIIDINGGNKLLDHQVAASSRAGKASKITRYHDCILKGKCIHSRSQLTKEALYTRTLNPSAPCKIPRCLKSASSSAVLKPLRILSFLFTNTPHLQFPWLLLPLENQSIPLPFIVSIATITSYSENILHSWVLL